MAKRDKLTKRQKRQVAHKQKQRLKSAKKAPKLLDLSEPKEGLLISRYGEQADVIDKSDKTVYRCYLRQNLGSPVPGDFVIFRIDSQNQGIVEALHERTSILERPAQHQGVKPVVSNITRVFVVVAPLPDFSSVLLDRYLVALHAANVEIIIVLNKWDLADEIAQQNIEAQLENYRLLKYSVLKVSTLNNTGLNELRKLAVNQNSILVGQSGVGKSSIINQLFPEQERQVKSVSENSRLGQHTTTSSKLFLFDNVEEQNAEKQNAEKQSAEKQNIKEHSSDNTCITDNGFIIDSPGIREFGLWHMEQTEIAEGFIEFESYIGSCKFRDCKHINEPGCEIINAVKHNKITLSRWQNYCAILSSEEFQN